MDLDEKLSRHRRFWQPLEKGEGGYLSVNAPIDDGGEPPVQMPPPKDLEEQWLSTDRRVLNMEAALKNTYFGLDAIPTAFVNYGPGAQAAVLGAPFKLQPSSVWFDLDPPIKSWEPFPVFKNDPQSVLYKSIEENTTALCENAKGRYFVSCTDIGGQMDILFSLRGEELLADLIEYPEEVLRVSENLDEEWIKYFNILNEIISAYKCGYTAWMPIICDTPWYPVQCDLSVMISPAMFEKFVLPSLDKISKAVGRSIYHLDGPGEIQHLDMILSLKNVDAIQWVPLPYQTSGIYQDFADAMAVDIYKRTLAAGKKVVLLGVHPSQVERIYNETGADGVLIHINHWSRRESDELIQHALKNWVKL